MPGVRGMAYAKPRQGAVRRKVWQSMRNLIRFTIPDLVRCSPPARINNVRKFVRSLATHGYVARLDDDYVSGRAGSYQGWRLVRNIGRDYPTICDRCGGILSGPCNKEE